MGMLDSTESRSWVQGQGGAPPWEVLPHPRSGQQCLRSRRPFVVGEILARFSAAATEDRPSRMTVQVSEHAHIALAPPSLSFMNHACEPNVHLDVEHRVAVAIASIVAGDELTFFYPSTEWMMASPFDCHCGSPRCIGWIAGASQVPPSLLRGRPLAPHIARLLGPAAGRVHVP